MDSRCEICGRQVDCLDEESRCEQCVLRAEQLATELFSTLEEVVRAGLECGLNEDQLREALELSLADVEGQVPDLSISRQPAGPGRPGTWFVAPYSAWLDYTPEFEPNRIRRLRRMRALSAEAVARRLGVTVSELALWEHSPEVPKDIAQELAGVFGVSVPHLMKTDMDWLQG